MLDTTRADAIGAYGAPGAHTPVMDALASSGVLFSQARSTSAWTVPSHGSLFTGLYPSRHGAHWESPGLDPSKATLAQVLSPEYQTAGFSENPHIIRAKGFAKGFERYEETWRRRRSWDEPPITLELVAEWVERLERGRPFFGFVNLMTPHLPYTPPHRYQSRFLPDVPAEQSERLRRVGEREARLYMSGALFIPPADFEVLRALYRAEVAFADERLGRILDMLRSRGLLEDTLVVVVGDHGENIGDHGLMEHQLCLYESVLRVPIILNLPGVLAGGLRREGPVQLVDVMPTVLAALGVDRARWPAMEGLNLLERDPEHERPVFAEYMRPLEQQRLFRAVNPAFDFSRYDRRLKSIQVGSLKLIVSDRGESELYDLAGDPGETRNLARERGAEVERLRAQLSAWATDWKPQAGAGSAPLDEEAERALRELGYIE